MNNLLVLKISNLLLLVICRDEAGQVLILKEIWKVNLNLKDYKGLSNYVNGIVIIRCLSKSTTDVTTKL